MDAHFITSDRSGIWHLANSLGMTRDVMPQIAANDVNRFIGSLKVSGVRVNNKQIQVYQLKPSQKELSAYRVQEKIDDYTKNGFRGIKPFIVSSDGYILDGHHQWAALMRLKPMLSVPCFVVSLTMKELIKEANKFDGVQYKSVRENKTMKSFKQFLNEEGAESTDSKPETETERVKKQQEIEKRDLEDKQRRAKETAERKDFENKLKDKQQQQAQKDSEKRAKEASRND